MKNALRSILILLLIQSCTSKQNEATDKIQSGVVEFEGISFHYVREGKGDPIVVIGSSVYYPRAFSKDFKDQFEMVFVDSRHFIPSYVPSDEDSISLSTWAGDLEIIRKNLGLGKIALIGHSIHAQIAIEYATLYPQNTKRLILLNGVPYSFSEFGEMRDNFWEEEADEKRKSAYEYRLSKRDSILSITPPDRQFAENYNINAPRFWIDPNYDATYLFDDVKTSPEAFSILVRSIPSKEVVKQKLENLRMPTIIILGRLDFGIPYLAWEQIIQGSQIEYHLMKDASHNPFTEDVTSREFNEILLEWISKN